MRELLLLRHGSTPGNELHRYNGRTDEPLSEQGRAALRARHYESAPLVYVTRLRRTRETAEILFPGGGVRLRESEAGLALLEEIR